MERLVRYSPLISLTALLTSAAALVTAGLGPGRPWAVIEAGDAITPPRGSDTIASPVPPVPDSRPRVMFPVLSPTEAPHPNHMISLAYNWNWSAETGWRRDQRANPSVALTVESWFRGLAEVNFDMRPPAGSTEWPGGRGFGFAARHDGSFATLLVGGDPYRAGGSGVQMTGGLTPDPVFTIFEGRNGAERDALQVQRASGSISFALRGGESPSLGFGLSGAAAEPGGAGLRFHGRADGPVIEAAGVGAGASVLSVRAESADRAPRLRVGADGTLEWGGGIADPDVRMMRTGPGRLETGAELALGALRVGDGTRLDAIRVFSVTVQPDAVAAHGTRDLEIEVPGVPETNLIFANGPAQPDGLALGGARITGPGRLAVRFVNAGPEEAQPAAGQYYFLAIEPHE